MNEKFKFALIAIVAIVMIALPNVIADPQILTADGYGHWFNDKNQDMTPYIARNDVIFESISYNPWVIHVTYPTLQYQTIQNTYNNGEKIIIESGGATITLTANTTTTLTVIT